MIPFCPPVLRVRHLGEVPEWSNGLVSKTSAASRLPGVRIPPSPPEAQKSSSRWFVGLCFVARLSSMNEITWEQFEQVELRVGTIVKAQDFPEARKPAYKITVDFGPDVGMKTSSAQVTALYTKEELVGRQIIGVVNFPPKQIGPFLSEFLITGFPQEDGTVILAVPERNVANGSKLA